MCADKQIKEYGRGILSALEDAISLVRHNIQSKVGLMHVPWWHIAGANFVGKQGL